LSGNSQAGAAQIHRGSQITLPEYGTTSRSKEIIVPHNTEAVACRIPTQHANTLRNIADFGGETVSAVLARIVVDRLTPTAPTSRTASAG
jgi:hypothetical protein